jgi:hypothetical protein
MLPLARLENSFEQTASVAQRHRIGLCLFHHSPTEKIMNDVVQVAKRLIPVEQIALIEPFLSTPNMTIRTMRDFKSRIILLDKSSVLAEDTPEQLAAANSFRMIIMDRTAANPAVAFRVETFEPTEAFKSDRPFQTRLSWNGPNGSSHSKLLISSPEIVLAVAIRGEVDPTAQDDDLAAEPPAQPRARTRRKPALVPRDPA